MKALAAERAARNGSALPRQTPKPAPQGSRIEFTGQRVKAEPKAMFDKELNSVPRGLEDLVKPLPPGDAYVRPRTSSTALSSTRGTMRRRTRRRAATPWRTRRGARFLSTTPSYEVRRRLRDACVAMPLPW